MIPVDLAVTTLVCFTNFAREAAGAAGTRLSLRPLFSRGETVSFTPRAHRAAGSRIYGSIGATSLRGAQRTKQSMIVAAVGFWIASRSLSSGAHSRDPLARNDGTATKSAV